MKNIKISPRKECITQHKILVCDFKIRKVKDSKRRFVFRRKIWKLHEDNVHSDFKSYIIKYIASSQKDASDEDYWSILKGVLQEATDRSYGWAKGPARHKETRWWNDDVSNTVIEKRELRKEGNKETRLKKSIYKQRKNVGELFM